MKRIAVCTTAFLANSQNAPVSCEELRLPNHVSGGVVKEPALNVLDVPLSSRCHESRQVRFRFSL